MEEKSKQSEYVMYIVINKDLNMSAGKIAAQAGHVIVNYMCEMCGCIRLCQMEDTAYMYYQGEDNSDPHKKEDYMRWFNKWGVMSRWVDDGQPKVVLGASQKTMEKLIEKFEVYLIHDEGRTEIPPDSLTALCFPPMQRKDAPKEIRRLRLY